MNTFSSYLSGVIDWFNRVLYSQGVIWAVLWASVKPSTWTRPRRQTLAAQINQIGVSAVPIIAVLAPLISVVAVLQTFHWLRRLGGTELFGDLYVFLIVNVIAPLLVAFLLIARSGTAMVSELSDPDRRQDGEDPLLDVVLPRVLGMMISMFCLSVLFVGFSILSGCLFGTLGSESELEEYSDFLNPVFRSLEATDMLMFVIEVTLIGLIVGANCCCEGLGVGQKVRSGHHAVSRAVLASLVVVIIFAGIIFLLAFSPDESHTWAHQPVEGAL